MTKSSLDLSRVNADTARVLGFVSQCKEASSFLLVGGTGLAAQIGHRDSLDVDLALPGPLGSSLPKRAIDSMTRKLRSLGLQVEETVDTAAAADFENDGMNLADAQRDFVVDGIKVQLFVPHHLLAPQSDERAQIGTLPVATPREIFGMKAGVTAERLRGRDAYDLYVLFNRFNFTLDDFDEGLRDSGHIQNRAIALERLVKMRLSPDDPWVTGLTDSPVDPQEIGRFFRQLRDQDERALAARAFAPSPR